MTGHKSRIGRALTWLLVACTASLVWMTRGGSRWPSVYYMTGASMEPTIAAERYFLAWNPPGELARGDLVIFRYQEGDSVFHVLRRLAGLPGDTISMRNGAVAVNGVPQPWRFRIIEREAWRSVLARDGNLYSWGPWVVPVDSVFLLADTRDIIGWPDSRFLGPIPRTLIVAHATRSVRGTPLR
jgi:signal peptidase I